MIVPLRFSIVKHRLLAAQQVLNPTLNEPIISRLALLTLSRPGSVVMIGDDEMYVMEFFGLWWVCGPHGEYGWFTSERDAVEHLKALLTG